MLPGTASWYCFPQPPAHLDTFVAALDTFVACSCGRCVQPVHAPEGTSARLCPSWAPDILHDSASLTSWCVLTPMALSFVPFAAPPPSPSSLVFCLLMRSPAYRLPKVPTASASVPPNFPPACVLPPLFVYLTYMGSAHGISRLQPHAPQHLVRRISTHAPQPNSPSSSFHLYTLTKCHLLLDCGWECYTVHFL